jgi:phospholipase C
VGVTFIPLTPTKQFLGWVATAAALVCAGCGTPLASEPNGDTPKSSLASSSDQAKAVDSGRKLNSPPASTGVNGNNANQPALVSANVTPEKSQAHPEPSPTAPNAQCQPQMQLIINRASRPNRAMPLTVSADPENIVAGASSTLRWTSQNTTQVTIDHGVGTFSPSGNVNVSPTQNTVYTITASGPAGSVTQLVTVAVSSTGVTLSASASPQRITQGQPATLSWSTTGASSVSIDNGIGNVAVSGSINVSPSADTTYTVTATCPGGSTSTQVTVQVQSQEAGIGAVNHIIFMLQENRSFDTYFGKLNDYRAAQGLPQNVDGIPANAVNYENDGTAVPAFKLQTECIEELTAAWNESHWDFNLHNPTSTTPLMDGYVSTAQGFAQFQGEMDTAGKRAMGYYDASDLNYYYFMATEFATSDRFFSPAPTQSVPNRLYAFAATSAGYTKPPTKTLTTKTIFQSLDDAGISWKIYYSDKLPDGQPATTLFTFFNYSQQHLAQIVPVNPNYFNDAAAGTLPQVAFIEHGSQSGRDEHPGGSNIQTGATYISTIINALMNSPSWHDSVFFLGYDEAGGTYDHVPGLTNVPSPDGIAPIDLAQGDIQGDFTRTGFRVPMMVVSPFTVKNLVSHTPMDYTAILKFIETRFNLLPLTARDAAMPDMTEFFDFVNPPWMTPPNPPAQNTNGACYLDHLP